MYTVKDTIRNQEFNKVKVEKVVKTETIEILSISLEKDVIFPEHISPTDAQLIVLQGDIDFHIQGRTFNITEQQDFSFPKEIAHWVKANENSKFLIIR